MIGWWLCCIINNEFMHITDEKLKELVLQSGVINEAAFNSATDEADRAGQSIQSVLIGRGDTTEDYLIEILDPYFRTPHIDLRKVEIKKEMLEQIPEAFAKANGVVLYELLKDKKIAKVAMLDPFDFDTIEFLRAKFGMWVDVSWTTQTNLNFALKQYGKQIGASFNQTIAENIQKFLSLSGEADVAKLAESVSIITILDSILERAIVLNASDIHFEPLAKKEILVRFRVDGILQEILSLNEVVQPILVARVKILAGMQIDEHRIPQDGRFKFTLDDGSSIDIRVNVMPVMYGEKVEMRILKSSSRPLSLADLGISPGGVAAVEIEVKRPHGMLLVTGPTGHGKTTTLYSILHILNTSKVNITTIEDPIEYSVSGVNQTQVNVKAGITFGSGLRALLRQNPDIIMIGEIRDNETVEIAVHAALTGHLVLSSLHTNDAPSAIPRLIDMGAPPFLLASTVNVVIAQRLVRKICTSCVHSYKVPAPIVQLIKKQLAIARGTKGRAVSEKLYRGEGCNACGHSGFTGQIGVFEIFSVSDSIRNLILSSSSVGEIRKAAIKEGMVTMFEDGLDKAERGVTTIEEVLRVVNE